MSGTESSKQITQSISSTKPTQYPQFANKVVFLLPLTPIYQSPAGLRAAMPDHTGDWHFTGRYPTPGGNKVLNPSCLFPNACFHRRISKKPNEKIGRASPSHDAVAGFARFVGWVERSDTHRVSSGISWMHPVHLPTLDQ